MLVAQLLEEEETLDLEQEVVRVELDHQQTQAELVVLEAMSIKVDMVLPTVVTKDLVVAAVVSTAVEKVEETLVPLVAVEGLVIPIHHTFLPHRWPQAMVQPQEIVEMVIEVFMEIQEEQDELLLPTIHDRMIF